MWIKYQFYKNTLASFKEQIPHQMFSDQYRSLKMTSIVLLFFIVYKETYFLLSHKEIMKTLNLANWDIIRWKSILHRRKKCKSFSLSAYRLIKYLHDKTLYRENAKWGRKIWIEYMY